MATCLYSQYFYLGLYSILGTAGLGGVYIYSCISYCGCCRVTGAVIKVTSSVVIRTTCGTAVGIASRISRYFYGYYCGYYYRYCYRYYYRYY